MNQANMYSRLTLLRKYNQTKIWLRTRVVGHILSVIGLYFAILVWKAPMPTLLNFNDDIMGVLGYFLIPPSIVFAIFYFHRLYLLFLVDLLFMSFKEFDGDVIGCSFGGSVEMFPPIWTPRVGSLMENKKLVFRNRMIEHDSEDLKKSVTHICCICGKYSRVVIEMIDMTMIDRQQVYELIFKWSSGRTVSECLSKMYHTKVPADQEWRVGTRLVEKNPHIIVSSLSGGIGSRVQNQTKYDAKTGLVLEKVTSSEIQRARILFYELWATGGHYSRYRRNSRP